MWVVCCFGVFFSCCSETESGAEIGTDGQGAGSVPAHCSCFVYGCSS